MARRVLRSGLLVLAFLIASCSGGGGGGGGGDSPRLNVSPTSFTFTATQNGATPAPQEAGVSISGGTVAVGIPSNSASGFVNAAFTITGQTTGKITLTPVSPSFVSPGTHTGTVVVRGCGDQFCSSGDVAGSPVSINVSYTVQPQNGLRASPQSLSFTQLKGGPAPIAQTLGLSDTNSASYAWSASIVYQSGSGWLKINGADTAGAGSLPANLSVSVIPTTTVGTLNALIRFTGPGTTLDVPVSYTVNEPTLTRSPAQMTFSAAANGALPSTQTVTLSTQSSLPVDYTTSITYGAGQPPGWLNRPPDGTAPGNVTVGVNTTALAQGTYTATLTFTTAANHVVSVDVTYVVASASITFSPGSALFEVSPTSNATALSNTVSVGTTGGAFSWSASSNQPWVTVTPSGTTPSTVTLTLNRTALETLEPGTQTATITFSYTPPGGNATSTPLSVTFNNRLPKVTSVNPYVATSGTSLEIVLRGSGFLAAGNPAINFGSGGSVTTYTVISDAEIRVTHPTLTAGTYRVSFANQLGAPEVVRSTADLVVVNAPVYAATSLAYPPAASRTVQRIVYDPERRALLVAVRLPLTGDTGDLYRYTFDGSAWSPMPTSSATIGGLRDFAPQLDGRKLSVVSNTDVTPFDAATLAPGTPTSVSLGPLLFLNRIAMANDGVAILTLGIQGSGLLDAYSYTVADGTFTKIAFSEFFNARMGASANGSRVVIVSSGAGTRPVYQYDATARALAQTILSLNVLPSTPALNRSPTRILIGNNAVYDSNYQLLGTIPFQNTNVLSPDGTRAYTYERTIPSGGGTVISVVHVYDLTAAPVGGVFPEIGTGTATPSDPGSGTDPLNPPATPMTISPDGGTLFIAGNAGIVVMPAP